MENENWKAQLSFKAGEGMLNLRFGSLSELQDFVMIQKQSQGLVNSCLKMLEGEGIPVLPSHTAPSSAPATTERAQAREVIASKEPKCKSCGSAMWDNRTTKTSAKAPDWKCKNKNCGYVNSAGYAGDAAWIRFNKKTGGEFLSWASEKDKRDNNVFDEELPI